MSVERQSFPADASHAAWLRLLLAHDGSTTRLCEAVAQAPMQVVLHQQVRSAEVPPEVVEHLGGERWLCRVTSLCDPRGQVLMDNLSFTRLDAVPAWFLQKLDEGRAPIGHMLDALFVRREPVPTTAALQQMLWRHVGVPDDAASRSYRIVTPEQPLMLIFEVFRAGMIAVA
jgi:chorismate-pyruvate lyase